METTLPLEGSLAPLLNNPLVLTYTLFMSLMLLSLLRYASARNAMAFQTGPLLFKRHGGLSLPLPLSPSSLSSFSSTTTCPPSSYIPCVINETFTPCGTLMPNPVHRILPRSNVKERILIIGDVHGCLEELQSLLIKANYSPQQDTVILVGDLVNKGPLSAETVQYCRENNFLSVRGNHDDSALSAFFRTGKFKGMATLPPAYEYVTKLKEEDVKWLNALPYTWSIPHMGVAVVHAGMLPGRSIGRQTASDMSRMRSVVKRGGEGEKWLEGVDYIRENEEEAAPWAKVWSEEGKEEGGGEVEQERPHLYFGHDARRGIQVERKATGLDTGCCYGRELTLAVLPGGERVSVKAFRAYQMPHGKE
ncbi:hypothetical protein VYU27_000595 [Nannochloropsis oceanica]